MSAEVSSPERNYKVIASVGTLLALIGLIAVGALYGTAGAKNVMASYVFGYSAALSMVLGCFGLTLLQGVTRSYWGSTILRIVEAGGSVGAFILMAVLYIPIWIGREHVYGGWIHRDWPLNNNTWFKTFWLTENNFILRIAGYFAIWIALAYFMRTWAAKEDETGDVKWKNLRGNVAAPGLVIYVLSVTLAATDMFMSIDAHWFSSMFGPWYMIGGVLFALSTAVLITATNAKYAPIKQVYTEQNAKDLGNLMFAFVMIWIYFTLSQYIIIWSGNLPEFIVYYKNRQAGILPVVGFINIALGWFAPWIALIPPRNKTNPKVLVSICVVLIAMRFVDMAWNMIPLFRPTFALSDLAAVFLMMGAWMAVFGYQLMKNRSMPVHDARIREALQHSHA